METAAAAGRRGRREHAVRERLATPVRYALRRLRANWPRTLIVGLGIAVGAAVLAMTAAGSAAVQDRAVQRALAQLQPSDRAIQAVWGGVPGQSNLTYAQLDRIARGAVEPILGQKPFGVLVFRESTWGGAYVNLGRCRRNRALARSAQWPTPAPVYAHGLRADPDRRRAGGAEASVPARRRARDVQGRCSALRVLRGRRRQAARRSSSRTASSAVRPRAAARRRARRAYVRLDRAGSAAVDSRLGPREPRCAARPCSGEARRAVGHLHDRRADRHDRLDPGDKPRCRGTVAHSRRRRGGAAARLRRPRVDPPPARSRRRTPPAHMVRCDAHADLASGAHRGRRHHRHREFRGLGGGHRCRCAARRPSGVAGRSRRHALDLDAACPMDRLPPRRRHGRHRAGGAPCRRGLLWWVTDHGRRRRGARCTRRDPACTRSREGGRDSASRRKRHGRVSPLVAGARAIRARGGGGATPRACTPPARARGPTCDAARSRSAALTRARTRRGVAHRRLLRAQCRNRGLRIFVSSDTRRGRTRAGAVRRSCPVCAERGSRQARHDPAGAATGAVQLDAGAARLRLRHGQRRP